MRYAEQLYLPGTEPVACEVRQIIAGRVFFCDMEAHPDTPDAHYFVRLAVPA